MSVLSPYPIKYSDHTRQSFDVQTSRKCSENSLTPLKITRSRPFSNRVEYMVQMLVLKLCNSENVGEPTPKVLRTDVSRRENKKRLRRAQMARALSNKHHKQFRRRFKNRGRSNRHIYTNKDMKM